MGKIENKISFWLKLSQYEKNLSLKIRFCLFNTIYRWKSKKRVTSSNPQVTSSSPRVTSLNPRVTSSNPRVRRLKAQVARLKA